MEKPISILITSLAMVFVLSTVGCSKKEFVEPYFPSSSTETTAEPASEQPTEDSTEQEVTANSSKYYPTYVLYKEELTSKANVIIQKINSELGSDTNVNASKLVEEKLSELSAIYNQGLSEFVVIMQEQNDEYDEYEYWAAELAEIYNESIDRIYSNCDIADLEQNEDKDY